MCLSILHGFSYFLFSLWKRKLKFFYQDNFVDLDVIIIQIKNLVYCFKSNNQFHIRTQHRGMLIVFMKGINKF